MAETTYPEARAGGIQRVKPLTPVAISKAEATTLLVVGTIALIVSGIGPYDRRVPLGFWVQELLGFARNHYDRLGHFAQGFVPAIIAREILLRKSPLVRGGWLFFLVCCVCLSVSVLYEFIEWWSALIGGESADAFLGTQGDQWDTQWDMFLAMVGSITAQLALGRIHDRQLER
jgi:putative membrane protein